MNDTRKDQKENDGCSGRSISQVNTERVSRTRSSDLSQDLSGMMCDLLYHKSAPEVEIKTFRGGPLEYHYFFAVFREVVELKNDDSMTD